MGIWMLFTQSLIKRSLNQLIQEFCKQMSGFAKVQRRRVEWGNEAKLLSDEAREVVKSSMRLNTILYHFDGLCIWQFSRERVSKPDRI